MTEKEVAALLEVATAQSALNQALYFLACQPRSAAEVQRHLAEKNVPEYVSKIVLERLRQRGYLDDAEFADYWIADRERFKPMSPRALRYELRQKGVDETLIDAALAEVDAAASAYQAGQQLLARYRGASPAAFRQKLGGLLRRRGFDVETIHKVVLRLQQEIDEREPAYFHGAVE